MKFRLKLIAFLILICMTAVSGIPAAFAAPDRESILNDVAAYLKATVTDPQVNSIGGEWSVIGLARAGMAEPDFLSCYLKTLQDKLESSGGSLHDKKYTEYSRVTLALTASGVDPHDVGGYDMLAPLGDFQKTVFQGVNGAAFALIALDSHSYEFTKTNTEQATREMYLRYLIEAQNEDGGFSLGGSASDADLTGMALQALSKYQDREDVAGAIDRALSFLSSAQKEDGGFESWETRNIESTAQVILALCELGIDLDDARFVKSGGGLYDDLLRYYRAGQGFSHELDGATNLMATEQGFLALVSIERVNSGKTSLYRMEDVKIEGLESPDEPDFGLSGKHEDIHEKPITNPGMTFGDISGHKNQAAIEALAARDMISGRGDDNFDPEATMTRAEFSTIVVRALGLPEKTLSVFGDVSAEQWYAPYIGSGYSYGLISGMTATEFAPNATITREQAAALVARAARLAGMNTDVTRQETRDLLAQFTDYVEVSDWASDSLAFCYRENILSQDDLEILPKAPILRCEIAEMLYRMLDAAKLLVE